VGEEKLGLDGVPGRPRSSSHARVLCDVHLLLLGDENPFGTLARAKIMFRDTRNFLGHEI
jgi:hypothetical protein